MANIYNHFSNSVKYVLEILTNAGFEAYVVGGAVRDALMKRKINDYDITTNALPEDVRDLFLENDYKVIDVGIKHGTVMVVKNNVSFEITTYRIETTYSDNRHPDEVVFSKKLEEDLIRRDFTINAMAASINGDVIDIFGGIDDINNKVIRTVGDPNKRFNEDALRMLRAIRFSSKLNFNISDETSNAIKTNCELIKNVSIERINKEMKMILSYKFGKHLKEYKDLFSIAYNCDKKYLESILTKIDNFPEHLMKIAYMLSFFNENEFKNIVNNIKISKDSKNKIIAFYNNTKEYTFETLNEYELKQIMSKYGLDFGFDIIKYICYYNNVDLLMINEKVESLREEVFTIETLDINGNDLMELGYYKEQISKALKILLDLVLKGKVKNEKNALMRALYDIDIDYMDFM